MCTVRNTVNAKGITISKRHYISINYVRQNYGQCLGKCHYAPRSRATELCVQELGDCVFLSLWQVIIMHFGFVCIGAGQLLRLLKERPVWHELP